MGADTFLRRRRVRFPSEEEPRGIKQSTLLLPTSLPGGQSKREPPDPIPTSEVKPLSADDSADYLCESRELPGSNCKNPRLNRAGVFLWALLRRRSTEFQPFPRPDLLANRTRGEGKAIPQTQGLSG